MINKIKDLKLALIILGIMHAFTNLGGSILSIIVSNLLRSKDIILYNIAFGYLIFAIIQISITNIFFLKLNLETLKFIWIPIIIYFFARLIFLKIKGNFFYKILNLFTLLYGIYIFIITLAKVI